MKYLYLVYLDAVPQGAFNTEDDAFEHIMSLIEEEAYFQYYMDTQYDPIIKPNTYEEYADSIMDEIGYEVIPYFN